MNDFKIRLLVTPDTRMSIQPINKAISKASSKQMAQKQFH